MINKPIIILDITTNLQKTIFDIVIEQMKRELEFEVHVINLESWYKRGISLEEFPVVYNLIPDNKASQNVWQNQEVADEFYSYLGYYEHNLSEVISQNESIQLFITTDDTGRFEKKTIEVFKKNKIPTVFLAHGFTPTHNFNYLSFLIKSKLFRKDEIYPFGLNGADYLIAINKSQYNFFLKWSLNFKKTFLTGYPYIDLLYEYISIKKTDIVEPSSLLFISSDYASFNYNFHTYIINKILPVLSKKFKSVTILLKQGESISNWNINCKVLESVKIIENKLHILDVYKLISSYEYVCGATSQLVLEAAVLGKKIFLVRDSSQKKSDYFSLINLGKVQCFTEQNIERIESSSFQPIDKSVISLLLDKSFLKFDGRNGKRVAIVLKELFRSSKK